MELLTQRNALAKFFGVRIMRPIERAHFSWSAAANQSEPRQQHMLSQFVFFFGRIERPRLESVTLAVERRAVNLV